MQGSSSTKKTTFITSKYKNHKWNFCQMVLSSSIGLDTVISEMRSGSTTNPFALTKAKQTESVATFHWLSNKSRLYGSEASVVNTDVMLSMMMTMSIGQFFKSQGYVQQLAIASFWPNIKNACIISEKTATVKRQYAGNDGTK
ncbi:hypothetical protein CLF_105190 [Clonorchis sinensis]|uniref:Uncharacterized protein n=1 Tax=Clonorchis sinensis TaxID=79923 RepID=G7YD58_CLOSI|nr:hypothetical protein CLF_105190 [Clonorchis sinensis]